MRTNILLITNNLISKYQYWKLFEEINDLDAFVRRVTEHLREHEIDFLTPAELGVTICSFDPGDIVTTQQGVFTNAFFTGDTEKYLRQMLALCLAYIIRDRLDPLSENKNVPRWENLQPK